MIRVQFVIFIFMVALLFLISSCGDDDDDNESDDDDFFPEDDDNDSTDDDSEDDDNVDDDDDSEGSPPKLSNAVAFPDVPAGPDATIIFIFDICDEDGDLGLDSGYEFYWSADDTSALENGTLKTILWKIR